MNQEYLKVSELNRFIKDVLNSGFPQPVWVCGEIQQYDRNKGKKHCFFELVEKDAESNEIVARIGLVIFANRRAYIDQVLGKSENAFELKDDIEVKFLCNVDFYPPHGAIRLIVENIDPTYTLGKIAQGKQKLIAALKEKGVLDKNKQLSLSAVPLRLGLITSDDSAAYNDFVSELTKSGYGFKVYVRNTLMQGKNSPKDVCRALDELKAVKDLDAVVITRGGGSLAELSCFDSRLIAEQIAAYPLPVLSGIGHEINITITDMAAHTYEKTPTAVARHLVGRVEVFLTGIEERWERIAALTEVCVENQKKFLKDGADRVHDATLAFLREHREGLIRIREILRQRPLRLLAAGNEDLREKKIGIRKAVQARLANEGKKVQGYRRMMEMAHPANTLKRGFSITRAKNGKAVKSVRGLSKGEPLVTVITDGTLYSRIDDIGKGEGLGGNEICESHAEA